MVFDNTNMVDHFLGSSVKKKKFCRLVNILLCCYVYISLMCRSADSDSDQPNMGREDKNVPGLVSLSPSSHEVQRTPGRSGEPLETRGTARNVHS